MTPKLSVHFQSRKVHILQQPKFYYICMHIANTRNLKIIGDNKLYTQCTICCHSYDLGQLQIRYGQNDQCSLVGGETNRSCAQIQVEHLYIMVDKLWKYDCSIERFIFKKKHYLNAVPTHAVTKKSSLL